MAVVENHKNTHKRQRYGDFDSQMRYPSFQMLGNIKLRENCGKEQITELLQTEYSSDHILQIMNDNFLHAIVFPFIFSEAEPFELTAIKKIQLHC